MAQQQGMFGPTPEELQMALMQQQQANNWKQGMDWGSRDLGQQISAASFMGGQGIGQGIGQLGQAMGVIPEDPRLAEARKLMEVKKSLMEAQIDPSNIDTFYPEMIKRLNAAGLSDQANKAMQQYTQAQTAQGNLEARRATQETQALTAAALAEQRRAAVAKQEQEQKALQGRVATVRRKMPELSEEEALGVASDTNAFKTLFETAKTKTQITEANGRKLLVNADTGETIKDLGTAPSRETKITVQTPKDIASNVMALEKALEPFYQVVNDSKKGKSFLNEAVRGQNPGGYEGARTILARAIGEGKLSNADIERIGVTPELVGRVKDFFTKTFTGVPTQQQLSQMYALFSILENQATENIVSRTKRVRAAAQEEGYKGNLDLVFPLPTQQPTQNNPSDDDLFKKYGIKR